MASLISNVNGVSEVEDFFGCNLKYLKEYKDYKEDNTSNIVVVSTSFFLPSNLETYDKGKISTYINGLIENIETFQYKIERFTTYPKNWIYRVYVDKFIMEDYETGLDIHKHFIFIKRLAKEYIKRLIDDSNNFKYKNVEIIQYNNNDARVTKYKEKITIILGHKDTFGTFLRFHPLTDNRIGFCIMRNCSYSLSPLDIIIQNYWIQFKSTDFKYMEYVQEGYYFLNDRQNFVKYKLLYPKLKLNNNNNRNIDDIKYSRSLAGLISIKLVLKDDIIYYKEKFEQYKTKFFGSKDIGVNVVSNPKTINKKLTKNNLKNNETKFMYGIDELILLFILPDLKYGKKNGIEINNKEVDKGDVDKNTFTIKESSQDVIFQNEFKLGVKFQKLYSTPSLFHQIPKYTYFNFDFISSGLEETNIYKVPFFIPNFITNSIDYKTKHIYILKYENSNNNFDLKQYLDDKYNGFKINEFDLFNKSKNENENISKMIHRYLELITSSYDETNFKPLVICPENFDILSLPEDTKLTLEDMLEPIKDKHKLTHISPVILDNPVKGGKRFITKKIKQIKNRKSKKKT